MTTPSHKTSLAFALGLLLALLLPANNLARLDGLPLAGLIEVIVLLLVVPVLVWREVREAAWGLVQRVRFGPPLAWLLLGLVFAAKLAMVVSGPMQGWPACYRAGIESIARYSGPIQSPACERSFDNPFFRGEVTRFDKAISFSGDTWNLGFINSSRFDFYDWLPGSPLRTRLPFEGMWSGNFRLETADTISVEYVGSGALRVDGAEMVLAPAYLQAALVDIPLAAGPHALELRYRFDDGSRSGQDPDTWGPRARLRLTHSDGAPLAAAAAALPWRALACGTDLTLGGLALLCLLAIVKTAKRQVLAALAMLAATVCLSLLPEARVQYLERVFGGLPVLQVSFAGLAVLLLAVHLRWRRLLPVALYLGLAVLSLAIMRRAYPAWDHVALRGAGNDNLVYESQARAMLQTESLQGGEDLYFYKFSYGYIKLGQHLLFGEGDVLYASMMLLGLLGSTFFALERFRTASGRGGSALLFLLTAAALLFVTGYYMARIVRDGLSEYVAWGAMLAAFPLLFAARGDRDFPVGAFLLGVGSLTRLNQLPGNLVVLVVALLIGSRNWKIWLAAGAAFGLPFLLPPLRQLVYGGANLSASSESAAFNLILGPHEWLGLLRGEAQPWGALLSQARMLIFAVPLEDWQAPVGMFAHIIMMAWLAVVGLQVGRRDWRETVVLLLPLPFILTHIVFVVQTYYPRHVIMGVLVMALAVLHLLASRGAAHPPQPAPMPSSA
jgi:hypothetical protein